jgi:uncharacterized membrane protein
MQRKPLPDLMKGIAVVFMVQVHIMELFARQEVLDSTLGKISLFLGGPTAAPVFLAIMGYFLALSNRSSKELARRGIKLLLLGLLLNIGLNLHLLIKIYSGIINEDPLKYIFGVDIFFVAGLSILIIALLRKILKESVLAYSLLMLVIPIIAMFIPDSADDKGFSTYLMSFFWMKTSWSYFPLIPWLAYPLSGYVFHLLERGNYGAVNWALDKKSSFLVISLIALSVTAVYPFKMIVDLPKYYHHGVLTFLWISAFILFEMMLLERVEREWGKSRVLKYLKWLGKNVTAVYVVQWLIIGNLATALYKTQFTAGFFLWFAIALAVSSVIVYGWTRARSLIRSS